MRYPNSVIAATLLTAASLISAQVCEAQSLSSMTGAGPGPVEANRGVSDVFVGRNTVGPYVLTWRNLLGATVRVARGARTLSPGLDYQVDLVSGTLTFAEALKAREIARADYRVDLRKAVQNTQAAAAPIGFKLLQGAGGALSFDALFRPDSTGPVGGRSGSAPPLMLLGMNGNARLGEGSSLTSKIYLDARGANLMERGALQVREDSKLSIGKFSAGFSRGGSAFGAANETGIKAGSQIIDASGQLNPIRGIAASASFQQTEDLTKEGKGTRTTTLGQKLTGTAGAGTRFSATRTETTFAAPGTDSVNRVQSRVQVDQALGAATSATALVENVRTETGGASTVTQSSTLRVSSQPSRIVSLSGSFQNRLLSSGAEDTADLRIEANPTNRVKLSAIFGEKYTQTAARRSREAAFEYTPGSRLSLAGGVQLRSMGGQEQVSQMLSGTAKPLPSFEVTGAVRLRSERASVGSAAVEALPNTYDVKTSLALLGSRLKLVGAYADNPEDEKGAVMRVRRHSLGLTSAWGTVDLTGAYSSDQTLTEVRVAESLDLQLGWRVARTTRISSGYKQTLAGSQSLAGTDTLSLGLTHKAGTGFDLSLSGAMTSYSQAGVLLPNRDYRADLRLGLKL